MIALASISNFPFHFCLHGEVACEARVWDTGLWGYKQLSCFFLIKQFLAKMWVFLVCLTALLVKLGHWIYTQKNSKSYNGKLPPGSMGFPIIGETIFCWSQILHILPSICEGFILPSQIRFFERVFWVHQKFLFANRLFFVMIYRQQKDIDQK